MPFHQYGRTIKVPRNDRVEIHVREVTLDPDGEKPIPCIEIREFLKEPEVYGHGLTVEASAARELAVAFDRLNLLAKKSVGVK